MPPARSTDRQERFSRCPGVLALLLVFYMVGT